MTHSPPMPANPPRVRLVSPPTYWRCEPGWSWHARPLPDYLLWYVLDGIGQLTLDGWHCELRPGTGIVFAPGDRPFAGHDPRRRLLIFGMHFEITAADVGQPTPEEIALPRHCQLRDQVLVSALARRCDIGYRRGDQLGVLQSRLCLEQILLLLWEDSLLPAPGPVDIALDEITHAIRQDPSQRWSVAELAARTALSRAQFTRRFTAHVGLSPVRYLIQARIDRARQLLTETNMSVTQVAATLGYADIAYFSRQYKRYTGHSPGSAHSAAPRSPYR